MMDALGKIITGRRLRRKCLRAWHSAYKEELQRWVWDAWALPDEAPGGLWGPGYTAWHLWPNTLPGLEMPCWALNLSKAQWGWSQKWEKRTGNRQHGEWLSLDERDALVSWAPWKLAETGQPDISCKTQCTDTTRHNKQPVCVTTIQKLLQNLLPPVGLP